MIRTMVLTLSYCSPLRMCLVHSFCSELSDKTVRAVEREQLFPVILQFAQVLEDKDVSLPAGEEVAASCHDVEVLLCCFAYSSVLAQFE